MPRLVSEAQDLRGQRLSARGVKSPLVGGRVQAVAWLRPRRGSPLSWRRGAEPASFIDGVVGRAPSPRAAVAAAIVESANRPAEIAGAVPVSGIPIATSRRP